MPVSHPPLHPSQGDGAVKSWLGLRPTGEVPGPTQPYSTPTHAHHTPPTPPPFNPVGVTARRAPASSLRVPSGPLVAERPRTRTEPSLHSPHPPPSLGRPRTCFLDEGKPLASWQLAPAPRLAHRAVSPGLLPPAGPHCPRAGPQAVAGAPGRSGTRSLQ